MKTLLLLVVLCSCLLRAWPQAEHNSHTWTQLALRLDHGPKVSLLSEAYIRRRLDLDRWQQLLLRPYVLYSLRPGFEVGLGYSHYRTWPYGRFFRPAPVPEHHAFLHLGLQHRPDGLERLSFQHRYRVERRWIGRLAEEETYRWTVADWQLAWRLRYRLLADFRLGAGWSAGAFGELFFDLDAPFGVRGINQARAAVYVSRQLGSRLTAQAGYLHQWINRPPAAWESNATLNLVLTYCLQTLKQPPAVEPA